jgi:RES domain-containing protein
MLYAAESLALCCVEVLVHLDKTEMPNDYVWSRAELLPEPQFLRYGDLWDEESTQLAGRLWVHTYKNQLGVLVPSVIVPESWNVLLNANHPGYRVLSWSKPEPFDFDRRLFHLEAV